MNRGEIRDIVRENLSDRGTTFYSDEEINLSIQDCYNEVVAKTLCITKTAPDLLWQSGKNYYDPVVDLGIPDYLGTVGIYNNSTNFWLFDNITLRDLDRVRRDWETWNGQPQYWCTHSLQRICIVPKLYLASGTFDLRYWAIAPILASDADSPLIASDMCDIFEYYCTADLLETADEISKAAPFWSDYFEHRDTYKQRVHNLARSELLLRI